MTRRVRDRLRRLARGAGGCLLAGAMTLPLGPTTTSRAVDQMNSMSTRPLPSVSPRPVVRDSMIWVPTRVVPVFGEPAVVVPGHWERRLPDTNEVHVPPLTIDRPSTGTSETIPAGIRPPVDDRSGP